MELFRLLGTIAVTNAEANQALDETVDKASSTHSKISGAFSKIGNAALVAGKVVATGMAAITAVFVSLGAMAVNYNAEMEQYQTSFEVMLGSQEEAVKMMDQLKETAAQTPFEMSDLANTTQLLLNYGLTADEASNKMLMLGDIAQGNADKMNRISTAYGQMSSAGKVSLEDVKQMIEAGFNPLKEISESTGESMESLYDRISKGTITVDEITAAMERATSEGGQYFQSMEKQSQTLSGQLSTLKDTVNNALGTAFQSVSDIMASTVIPKLSELAETYIPKLGIVVEQLLPPLMQIIDTILPILLNTIDGLLPLFVQFVEQLVPMLGSTLTTVIPLLLQVAQEIMPVLLQTFGELSVQLLPLISDILPILVDLLMILLPPLASLLPQAVGVLVPLLQNLADIIQIYIIPAIEMLVEWLGTVLRDTFQSVGLMIEGILQLVSSVLDNIIATFELFVAIFTGDWQGAWDALKRMFQAFLDFFVGLFKSTFSGLIVTFQNYGDKIKGFFVNAWDWCKNAFTTAKNFVSNIFTQIGNAITSKIQNAINFVKNGIDRIKSFFNFQWSLPKLKMPHFKISGSFSLNPPSVPSFGVDWYAKGGIMTEPTAFGINPNTGNVMVGGEAGDEAIAPITLLKQYVAEAVASQNTGLADAVNEGFATLMAFLQQYIPEMSNMQLVMDSGAVVGQLAPQMDAALGKLAVRNGRGV